ncbi:MAG TPA: hypothetical protein VIV60_25525 [Polyangiaceae bacterium]
MAKFDWFEGKIDRELIDKLDDQPTLAQDIETVSELLEDRATLLDVEHDALARVIEAARESERAYQSQLVSAKAADDAEERAEKAERERDTRREQAVIHMEAAAKAEQEVAALRCELEQANLNAQAIHNQATLLAEMLDEAIRQFDALIHTLRPYKSSWVQKVCQNASLAFERVRGAK